MSKTLSQIATALEGDKTAIRQAILSGGGTCPSSHGFDEFASDIGTIPTGGGSIYDSIRLVSSTSEIPPTKASLPQISQIYSYIGSSTSTVIEENLYKIAYGYDDPQYLKVKDIIGSSFYVEMCASFSNTRSYTSTAGTVTLYSFYYEPVFIPSYSTTSRSDCVKGNTISSSPYYFFDSSSQTTALSSVWDEEDFKSDLFRKDSDYDDYILGIYVYLKWKSSNKNDRIMRLHPIKIGKDL